MDEDKIEKRFKGIENSIKLALIMIVVSLTTSLAALAITLAVMLTSD